MLSLLVSFLFIIKCFYSHIEVKSPAPRRSIFSDYYQSTGNVDYNNKDPIPNSFVNKPSLCKGTKGPISAVYTAGDIVKFELNGSAIHNGGHCEWSLSFDEKTFISIHTLLGKCLKDQESKNYDIKLPNNLPSGNYVMTWSWINKIGNREFYMNCIDIKINQKSYTNNLFLEGPKMFVGNLVGYPTIPEFYDDYTGSEYYNNREIIRVYKPSNNDNTNTTPIATKTPFLTTTKKSTKTINTPVITSTKSKITTILPTKLPNNLCKFGESKCEGDKLAVCFGNKWVIHDCFFNRKCKSISDKQAQC